jgi:intracellular sulfur oxidation DsrE/DsrF family protein
MKKIFFIAALWVGIILQSSAQQKPYNIVFDLTTSDTSTHQRVIRWINGILTSHPDAKIEVVFYGTTPKDCIGIINPNSSQTKEMFREHVVADSHYL